MFIAVACAVGFITVKRLAGNLGKADSWWFGWAVTMLFLGPVVATGVYFSTV